MKYKIGMVGFVYPNPRSVISSLISYKTKGYYSHCFQFLGNDIIGHSIFPHGILIEDLTTHLQGRVFDVFKIKYVIDEKRLIKWWCSHQKQRYDYLYYLGYLMKKSHIQNPLAYTCNEAVVSATREAGVSLHGNSPAELAKDKRLEYIATIKL